MARYTGQRRAAKVKAPASSRGWLLLAIGGCVAAVAAGGAIAASGSGSSDGSGSGATGEGARIAGRSLCEDATRIGVAPAYESAWKRVAAGLDPDRSCLPVEVVARPSDEVAAGQFPDLDGWIPEGVSWLGRTSDTAAGPSEPTIVARTPLVLATTAEVATQTGDLRTTLTPAGFAPLVLATTTFADLGAPEFGELRVALPDVTRSATGALGFGALVQLATGHPLTGVPSYVEPTRRDLTTIRTEHRVVALATGDDTVLDELDPTDADAANLVVTSEAAAWSAAETQDLVTAYTGADLHLPLVTLHADAQTRLDAFADFLASSAGTRALTAVGLRPSTGKAAPVEAGGVVPSQYTSTQTAATAEQVAGIAELFNVMHQRISSLVLLDASGSMLESLPGTATSKIDLVRRAAHDTLRVASPRAQSGLMTFRSDDRDRPVIEAPIPLLANGMREGGQTHGERLAEAVDDLEVRGGTPLYNAVRDAYGLAVRSYQPDMVNQIVLLSDGRNEDARGSIGLGRLVRELEASLDPERPVRIIAIGYGPDADMAALRRIVGVTAGRASWLRDVDDYTGAVQEALFEL